MRKCLVIIISISVVFHIHAKEIDKQTASKIATNFINYQKPDNLGNITFIESEIIPLSSARNNLFAYLIWMQPRGYAIVAADDRALPILAYSYTALKENTNNAKNSSFRYWISQLGQQMDRITNSNIPVDISILKQWEALLKNQYSRSDRSDITPLITSTWNQDVFYNGFCPEDAAGPGGRAYAGCVATAMGQLMYYHRFPYYGQGSYSYNHITYGNIAADFENTDYDWNGMLDKLNEPNNAVAELLYHCGVAVDMVYGPNGSGMYNHKAAYALRTHFRYSPLTRYIFRDSVSLDWDSLLLDNLERKLPMYYAGWEADTLIGTAGHAFVCDGYQSPGYFHFNWGWGGSYDGYFYTNALNPAIYDFNWGQEVIVDVLPDTIHNAYPNYCTQKTFSETSGTFSDGSEPVFPYLHRQNCNWLIAPDENITKITLKFLRFETELNHDFVAVYDGEDTTAALLGKFSGNNLPTDVISTGKKMFVVFISDDSINADGFFASWSVTYPIYCSSVVTLTAENDTIDDGSAEWNYNNNSNCKWVIQGAPNTQIRIEFIEFDTELTRDNVKVYDAGQTPSLLLGTFSGSTIPPVLYSSSNKMMISFLTNQYITAGGWKAVYSIFTDVNEKNSSTGCFLYPNPVVDKLYFQLDDKKQQEIIVLIADLTGSILFEKKFISTEQASGINITDMSGFSTGIYFVSIKANNILKNYKLIKQ